MTFESKTQIEAGVDPKTARKARGDEFSNQRPPHLVEFVNSNDNSNEM